MKTILLAGGFGTRLSEETSLRPKPMVEIGTLPILVHIMGIYARHGFKDFLIAGGYKCDFIKDYFSSYYLRQHDFTLDMSTGKVERLGGSEIDWRISIVDTGLNTMTGGRIKQLADHVGAETFMTTYGDGVSNIDISKLVAFHKSHGKLATVTAVRPPARFGSLVINDGRVDEFEEKSPLKEGWINGGYFVLEPGVFDYIDGNDQPFEKKPLANLAKDGQLMAYRHGDFWQPMDTLRDKRHLEELWETGHAPWVG